MSFRTLAEMLKQSVEKYSDLMCSQMLGNTKMTFKELGERVEKVKQMFVSAGLKEGDKIITAGGIYGTVREVGQTTLLIEVDHNVTFRIDKNMVVGDPTQGIMQ